MDVPINPKHCIASSVGNIKMSLQQLTDLPLWGFKAVVVVVASALLCCSRVVEVTSALDMVAVDTTSTVSQVTPAPSTITTSPAHHFFFYVAGNGSDTNTGTSPQQPFKTLNKCVNTIYNGVASEDSATCLVANGTYRETVDMSAVLLATTASTTSRSPPPPPPPSSSAITVAPASASAVASGAAGSNVTGMRVVKAADGAKVVLSGLATLPTSLVWSRLPSSTNSHNALVSQCVWRAHITGEALRVINGSTKQLFYRGSPMVEARYPNLDISRSLATQLLRPRESWVRVGKGSKYGLIVDPGLRAFKKTINGARATLNVAHQFFTWTRKVSNFSATKGSFNYPKNLPGGADSWNPAWWGSNQFFLAGLPVLLDAPGEWVFDSETSSLLFWPPATSPSQSLSKENDTVQTATTSSSSTSCTTPPDTRDIEVKVRDYIFVQQQSVPSAVVTANDGREARHQQRLGLGLDPLTPGPTLYNFVLDGVDFFGATFALDKCTGCRVSNTRILYPSHDPEIPEMDAGGTGGQFGQHHSPNTRISGAGNLVENLTLAFSNNNGIGMSGQDSIMRNALVAFTGYLGTLMYTPMHAFGTNISLSRVEAYAFGNAGITTYTPNGTTNYTWKGTLTVSHSHIHGGGRVGLDQALLYTGGEPNNNHAAGVRWHHNIVHNNTEKCMRADDLSYGTTMDHNVVFHCGYTPDVDSRTPKSGLGITPKGDGHIVFANTVFETNSTDLCVPGCPRAPYAQQNAHSQIFNTMAGRIHGSPCSCNSSYTLLPGGNISGFYSVNVSRDLMDPSNFDFRPKSGSPLIDAGVIFPPYTSADNNVNQAGFQGAAPDIGAMEHGQPAWTAGCTGLFGCNSPEILLEWE